jgi:ADP-heptose:LPS heptosyltransferase
MKAIGLLGGQIGDLVISTPAIRAFKEKNPNFYFTLGISKKYAQAAPLFYGLDFIHYIYVWDTNIDDWPNEKDRSFIKSERFNIIFGAAGLHTEDFWYLKKDNHYTREFGKMFGIEVEDTQCELYPYFGMLENCRNIITLSMFPSMDVGQKKSLSVEQLEDLCINIRKLGFIPVQLGGKFERKLKNAEKPDLNLIEAAQLLHSSELHLTCDTSFGWISSAYMHKTIGFYANNLPKMTEQISKNIQPTNPKAYYFYRDNLLELKTEEILESIKLLI